MSSFLEMPGDGQKPARAVALATPGRPRWVGHGVRAPADRIWFQAVFAKSKHKIRVSSLAPSPHKAVAFSGVPLKKASGHGRMPGIGVRSPSRQAAGAAGRVSGRALLHVSGADSATRGWRRLGGSGLARPGSRQLSCVSGDGQASGLRHGERLHERK